ncbi:MAG: dihydroneopterin aldolase [Oscillospiraceae bacterium]|nr:dihydroneopterin aldolase [Oscillospiraceae bacterium]
MTVKLDKLDEIVIKGLKVFAYHGVNPEEKRNGQNFIFDLRIYADLSLPRKTDGVSDTIDYSKAVHTVIKTATEKSYNLIEKVADRVAEQLLADFADIARVDVLVKKPQAPIEADFDYVAVEIVKTQSRGP